MSPTAVLAAAAAPSALSALPAALPLVRRRHVDLLLHASARCRHPSQR